MFSELFLFLKAYFTLFTVTIRVIRLNNFHSISIFLTFINDILFLYVILSILFMFILFFSFILKFFPVSYLSHFLHDLLFLLLDLQYLLMSSNATSTISPIFSKIVVRIELVCNNFSAPFFSLTLTFVFPFYFTIVITFMACMNMDF